MTRVTYLPGRVLLHAADRHRAGNQRPAGLRPNAQASPRADRGTSQRALPGRARARANRRLIRRCGRIGPGGAATAESRRPCAHKSPPRRTPAPSPFTRQACAAGRACPEPSARIYDVPLVCIQRVFLDRLETERRHPRLGLIAGHLELGLVLVRAKFGVEIDDRDASG
jgi:hypothetical protein